MSSLRVQLSLTVLGFAALVSLSSLVLAGGTAVVHFDNIYFTVGEEVTDTVEPGDAVIMYVCVSNDSDDRKAFTVEWYVRYADGEESDTATTDASVPGKHIWKKPYVFSLKGKKGGTLTFKYKLYTVTGQLIDQATRKLRVKDAD